MSTEDLIISKNSSNIKVPKYCHAQVSLPEIKHLPYSERLQILKLPTMAYRRARGDMIEVFKIVAHIYDSKTSNVLNFREKLNISLRGHEFTLENKRFSCPARVHFFYKYLL